MKDDNNKGADFYSLEPEVERLWCETPEEALAECDVEYPVTVYAWRRKVLSAKEIEWFAEAVVDNLQEIIGEAEWADPENPHDIREEFDAALRAVVRKHLPLETVWCCERAPELDVVMEAAP